MADIVRTASIDPSFHGALRVHLLETSTVLRARQVQSLARLGVTPTHHADLAALPELPSLWVANEFFDALPADQWMRTPNGWNARKVGLDPYNALVFGVDPTPYPAPKPFSFDPPLGTIIEHSPAQDSMVCAVAMHAARNTGAGLIIDYGSLETGTGDTLQAVRAHAKADPLADPGLADLTTHVDFAHLARTAQSAAPVTVGSAQQGAFLLTMGLLERAGHLGANALPDVQDAISLAVERLAGDAAMGKLFKVMGFAYPHFPMPGLNAHPQTARGAT